MMALFFKIAPLLIWGAVFLVLLILVVLDAHRNRRS